MWGYHCSLLDFAILSSIWRLQSFHTNLPPWSLMLCLVATHQMVSWPKTQHESIHRLLFLRQQSITAIVCNLTLGYIAAVQTFFFSRTHDSFYKRLHGLGLMTLRDWLHFVTVNWPKLHIQKLYLHGASEFTTVRALGISQTTNYTTEQFPKAVLL